ncbi:Cytochrome P450 [Dillenia turbinata]|uniref:Cytochrome P450 n=1 Tax=Dillenia turbinata TaxID=194707 RepID=A0AAN8ZFY7_9MAGN
MELKKMIKGYEDMMPIVVAFVAVFLWFLLVRRLKAKSKYPSPPAVPGLPIIGNLLQLKEKKPYKTFTKWAETYGPIYSIKTGANTMVVLNNSEVVKEAMVTKYSSISSRKLSNALKILTHDKCMVAISDYNDFHKTVKRFILASLLGPAAQKRLRNNRDTMIANCTTQMHAHVKNNPGQALNFRSIFQSELFGIAMKQAVGRDLESLYVPEFGHSVTRHELLEILVTAPMEGAIEVDWRDFFPYLRWVPNKRVEDKINTMDFRRDAVMRALINEQRKRFDTAGEDEKQCFLYYLLEHGKNLKEKQLQILLWEPIIETSDTTMVTTEWAMYELGKDPVRQERLYNEITKVCGSNTVTEDMLSQIPYLTAVFHETLRYHNPVAVVPLRYVHEDTELGGYNIPAGTEIAINLYGCNMDKKQWENADKWLPQRFLDPKYDPMDLHKTMAFGGGKRVCAGALQASLIACAALGRFVQEFEWSLKPGEEEDVDTVGLTTLKLRPLHVVMKPRKC